MKKLKQKYYILNSGILKLIGIVLIAFLLLLFVLSAIHDALETWKHLQQLPLSIYYSYIVFIGISIPISLWLASKLLDSTPPLSFTKEESDNKGITTERILKELNKAKKIGIDISDIRHEMDELQKRKNAGTFHVALFGDVSTGKSSIIKALRPDAQIHISVCGGTTQEIKEYTWTDTSGDQLILTDLPGRNEVSGVLDLLAQEEAIRAQIVIYVMDSDITRTQFNDIQQLKDFGKPLLVALNKSDRFSEEEKALFQKRFEKHFPNQSIQLLFIQSGGKEEVIKIYPDGHEETVIRNRKAKVATLAKILQKEIKTQSKKLEKMRDASVYKLVKQKLDNAKKTFRKTNTNTIINNSTLKAVFGALVAISPGSDLVIQGVLGTLMVKQLCALYDVPIQQLNQKLNINKLLGFSANKIKKCSAPVLIVVLIIALVIAGNILKAFPGIGTITGGLFHAVAYGLIFNALGHTVNDTLKEMESSY